MAHIITVDPKTDRVWNLLVRRRGSSVFHSPAWLATLVDTYSFDVRAHILVNEAGELQAGIPFARVADFFGERLVALPFSDYCDPLVGTPEGWSALVQPLIDECRPITLRCLHNLLPLADERFQQVKRARWHRVDISADLDSIWARCTDLYAIKRALRDDVTVVPRQDKEAVQTFFNLHLGIRKYKYQLLSQPYKFFENVWRHFIEPGDGVILTAIHKGQIIAASVVLKWQDTLYYKFSASARNHLGARPNDLLIWEMIRYAKSVGCTSVDLGLSDWDQEGLVGFKRKFATEEKTISFLKYIPDHGSQTEKETELRSLMGQLTGLLTDPSVPDAISEKAGDLLYRYFV